MTFVNAPTTRSDRFRYFVFHRILASCPIPNGREARGFLIKIN
jgi:hypothetical protein